MDERIRNILVFILIGFVLLTTVFVSGCTQQGGSTLKSEQEVGQAVQDMSVNIDDLTSTLEDIDKTLG